MQSETNQLDLSTEYVTDIDYDYLESIKDNSDYKLQLYGYILQNFVHDRYRNKKLKYINQCKLMEKVNAAVGFKTTADQFIMEMADYKHINSQSTAGSGKTSMSQMRILREKLINQVKGIDVLCVTYTDEAAKHMQIKQEELVNTLKKAVGDLDIDSSVMASTWHSLAYNFIIENNGKYTDMYFINTEETTRVKGYSPLMVDEEVEKYMGQCLNLWLRDNGLTIPDKDRSIVLKNLVSLYTWRYEKLDLNLDNLDKCVYYLTIKRCIPNVEDILKIFTYYKIKKQSMKKCDMADILYWFFLLLQKKEMLDLIRSRYRLILFDEFQDISEVMLRSLYLISLGSKQLGLEPDWGLKLTIVADIDQMLYAFRGVSVETSLKFKEMFMPEETKIVSLSVNRRSLKPIVDASAYLIKKNKLRIQKPIKYIRNTSPLPEEKGLPLEKSKWKALEVIGVKNSDEYSDLVCKELQECLKTGESASIQYRNAINGAYMALKLFLNSIPAKIVKGVPAFKDSYSEVLLSTLDMLANPTSINSISNCIRFLLPSSRATNRYAINSYMAKEKSIYESGETGYIIKKFWEYEYPGLNWKGRDILNELKSISYKIEQGVFVSEIFNDIRSYINFKTLSYERFAVSENHMSLINEVLNVDEPYSTFYKNFMSDLDAYNYKCKESKFELCTMHSVKGLEKDRVYIIELSDNIFPGRELTDCQFDEYQEMLAIESTRRLFFVAMTRAENRLVILPDLNNISRIIGDLPEEYLDENIKVSLQNRSKVEIDSKTVISDIEEVDTQECPANDSDYLKSLPIKTLEYNGTIAKGYFNGYLHVGDYVYDKSNINKEEQTESDNIIDSDLFGDL